MRRLPESFVPPGTEAAASWWVVDDTVGTLDAFVPLWPPETWGFWSVSYAP